jgi:hypothetical protein
MPKPNVTVVPKAGDEPLPVEVIERAVVELAAGMKRLNDTRLKRETIVALLHDTSGIGKRQIEVILNCLDRLEQLYLKPKKVA